MGEVTISSSRLNFPNTVRKGIAVIMRLAAAFVHSETSGENKSQKRDEEKEREKKRTNILKHIQLGRNNHKFGALNPT